MSKNKGKIPFSESIEEAIRRHTGDIWDCRSIGGGCIANASRIETEKGPFFLKWGPETVARTFEAEAEGLKALRKAGSSLVIPEVIDFEKNGRGYLLLEWIEPGQAHSRTMEEFGKGLAELHRYSANTCGFSIDNFIGRLPQENAWIENWPEFFRVRRLEPQARLARKAGRWRTAWDGLLEGLYHRLDSLLPAHATASLLHGDLWSGNYMISSTGRVTLIDPATYYGHREADLAMTELFGGFSSSFYYAYREAWPLEKEYEERRDIYNLYHLINHLNHFGFSYAQGVERILRRFGS